MQVEFSNEFEKIETLKGEINERKEQIKEAMFNIVKRYGGVVECEGKSYKATENIDVNCDIIAFNIADDKLIVKTDFDGDYFDLGLDSFNTVVMADILIQMLADQARLVQDKISKLYDEYSQRHNESPQFAVCKVKFLDGGDEGDVNIKLASDLDIDDDEIFYYCNSAKDLRFLTMVGCNDFIVTDIYEFKSNL
ncbi:MAG: hypothetical protein SNJ29_13025 [Rikenellaceae bacterium]